MTAFIDVSVFITLKLYPCAIRGLRSLYLSSQARHSGVCRSVFRYYNSNYHVHQRNGNFSFQVKYTGVTARHASTFEEYHQLVSKDYQLSIFKKKSKNYEVYVEQDVLKDICRIFKVADASRLVTCPKLQHCKSGNIRDTIAFLHQNNVTASHLKYAPWLLCQTVDELNRKSELISQFGLFENLLHGLGFFLFTTEMIAAYHRHFESEKVNFLPYRNRIYYICNQLNLPVDDFVIKIVVAWKILLFNKLKLDEVINLLQEFSIESRIVVSDPWIFYASVERSWRRLTELSSITPEIPKLWVCQCSEHSFQRYCLRFEPVQNAGPQNADAVYNFLAHQLNTNVEELEKHLGYRGRVLDVTLIRMKRNLELLKNFGFTGDHIRRSLAVLKCATSVITKRLHLLRELDLKPEDLSISAISAAARAFEAYYERCKMDHEIKRRLRKKE